MNLNYDEIARDLYALGSWAIMMILLVILSLLRNSTLIVEVLIALALAFILSGLFNPDDRIVRLVIFLTSVALLGNTARWIIAALSIGVLALVMTERYLDKPDVWRSAFIGVLVQGLALFFSSFI